MNPSLLVIVVLIHPIGRRVFPESTRPNAHFDSIQPVPHEFVVQDGESENVRVFESKAQAMAYGYDHFPHVSPQISLSPRK